eukprot:s5094_g4.t1
MNSELWGDLRQPIVERTGKEEKDRAKNQDYLAAVHYLPAGLVAQLESNRNRSQVLELLCSHLLKLGLRHPSEKTCGLILALVFDFQGVSFEADKWQYTLLHKNTIQRLLNKPDATVFCETLPVDPTQCPSELYRLAFPDGSQPCAIANPVEMILRGRTWPLRTTHRVAAQASHSTATSSTGKPDYYAMGQMVAGIMSTGQARSAVSTGHPVLPQSSAIPSGKPALLALEDGSPEDHVEPSKKDHVEPSKKVPAETSQQAMKRDHPAGETAVAATLAALKQETIAAEPEGKVGKPMKRPASGKILKKPASKVQKKNETEKVSDRDSSHEEKDSEEDVEEEEDMDVPDEKVHAEGKKNEALVSPFEKTEERKKEKSQERHRSRQDGRGLACAEPEQESSSGDDSPPPPPVPAKKKKKERSSGSGRQEFEDSLADLERLRESVTLLPEASWAYVAQLQVQHLLDDVVHVLGAPYEEETQ